MNRHGILLCAFAVFAIFAFLNSSAAQTAASDYPIRAVPLTSVRLTDAFWRPRLDTNRTVTIPHILRQNELTGRIDNFLKAARKMEGAYQGQRYNDTDVYKIVEAASYSLQAHPDAALDRKIDELIAIVAAAQEPDGYLYTPRSVDPKNPAPGAGPERWSWLHTSHELYDQGHMIEAAVAHFQATGKRSLLTVAIKSADLMCRVFGPDGRHDAPGHEEIELALVKLYRVTGDPKYLDQAQRFLDERGRTHTSPPEAFEPGSRFAMYNDLAYRQDHKPVAEETRAVGHAVRATYLYAGMTDAATLVADSKYASTVQALFQDVTAKRIYVTGGLGSDGRNEAFGGDYVLPNRAYAETCASIGGMLWYHRMFLREGDAKYYDVFERTLYNGYLSGVSIAGDTFFYQNPLISNGTPARSAYFDVACCPANLARLMAQLPGLIYAQRERDVYVNLFVDSTADLTLGGVHVNLHQHTNYPWDGRVAFQIDPGQPMDLTLAIRIPGWSRGQAMPTDLYQFAKTGGPGRPVVRLNRKPVPLRLEKGYVRISRRWASRSSPGRGSSRCHTTRGTIAGRARWRCGFRTGDVMRKSIALGFVSVALATAVSSAVPDKVTFKARAFPLQDVRLLDGPFKQAMKLDQDYLLALDPDRLLHNFRVNAALPSSAKPLGGWEAPDVELRGHTVGHYLSALALMYAATGDARFKTRADAMVDELAAIQAAQATRFHEGYLSAFPEEFFDRVEARQRVWAPYYTIHKIMAGLLDVHELCGNARALQVVTKMADWVKYRVDHITEEQQQRALGTEFGGMNEVLANIYAATGNSEYLRVAHAFDHKAIFDPLTRREDPLNGLHANTQFPKIIGAAREYELTGDTRFQNIATFFWDRVVNHRSYVMGGNSDGESFFPEEEFSKHLGASGPETCNTYNMLKLTRHIFEWSADAGAMDFYERGLFNHILPSQDPATGMVIYYCPLRPGAWKTYSTSDESFWCCVGTGMENHTKYGDTIYFHDDRSLYVNLFIPSELTWRDQGIGVRQETRFPEEEATHLTIRTKQPVRFALKVRYPSWTRTMTATVNDVAQALSPAGAPSYVTLDREWRDGDRVDVRMPMSLRTQAMPDNPRMIAIMYGPIVLAGDLGKDGLDSVRRYGPSAPQVGRVKTPAIPALVGDLNTITARLVPDRSGPLQFKSSGLGKPHDVTLLPFYRIVDQRYTVYWNVYSPDEWKAHTLEAAAVEARRSEFERRSLDVVAIHDAASETAHGLQSENATDGYFEGRRTREARNGWFSYQLKVAATGPTTVVCSYRGSEGRRRVFDVLVDGEKVATETLEYHPTEQLDREYAVPESLTRGKERVTIRFQAHTDTTAGAVIEVRTIGGR